MSKRMKEEQSSVQTHEAGIRNTIVLLDSFTRF